MGSHGQKPVVIGLSGRKGRTFHAGADSSSPIARAEGSCDQASGPEPGLDIVPAGQDCQ